MKDRPTSLIITITDQDGKELGKAIAAPKKFTTGSEGFNGFGKIQDANRPEDRYQLSLNVIRIGSKPKQAKQAKIA